MTVKKRFGSQTIRNWELIRELRLLIPLTVGRMDVLTQISHHNSQSLIKSRFRCFTLHQKITHLKCPKHILGKDYEDCDRGTCEKSGLNLPSPIAMKLIEQKLDDMGIRDQELLEKYLLVQAMR